MVIRNASETRAAVSTHREHDLDRARLAPLMLATMASQALLVVLAPTIVAVGADLGASVGAVGQARSITAAIAIAASAVVTRRIDTMAISRLVAFGAALAIVASGTIAAAPTLAAFMLAHVLVGIAVACLLSAGFAGVAAFEPDRRAWAIGYVAGANALAWIVVTPTVGILSDRLSWRAAQAVPAAVALGALIAAPLAASTTSASNPPGLRALLSHPPARLWIGAELMAYGAWTALLTFVGAFFIERLAVGPSVVGWLLAAGAASYFVASTRSPGIAVAKSRRRVVAGATLLMAILFVFQLDSAAPQTVEVGIFCLLAIAAGIRFPASSALGLEQLPHHPGAMMAARTAANQLGYLVGALIGGAVIAGSGYAMLGVLFATSMAGSAWLILRVDDPREAVAPSSSTERCAEGDRRASLVTPYCAGARQ